MAKRWVVYRLFDGQDLLYVGMSGDLQRRLREHTKTTPGWNRHEVAGTFRNRGAALRAEAATIAGMNPKLNRQRQHQPMTAAEVAEAADQLLASAIREGRLSRKPSLTTLNRIAGIIAPVLASMPAPIASLALRTTTKRSRRGGPTTQRPRKEAEVANTTRNP